MKDSIPVVTMVKLTVEDKMVIADPCYVDKNDGDTTEAVLAHHQDGSWDDWGVVLDGCAGEWTGEIVIETETHGWGDRVSILRLTREDVRLTYQYSYALDPFELVGHAAVDSGQMYAAGVEHLPVDYDSLLDQYYVGGKRDLQNISENWINHKCLASNGGIVSSTGYGDGTYPVYVAAGADGKPAIVEVRFLGEDDDEDEE